MAMQNPRPEKVAVVEEVRGRLSSSNAALLTEYRGLKVDELARLRQAIRQAGGDYKIYKNTLVRLAVADLGLTELDDLLTGPTAVAFVDGDAVLVAKALRDFARASPALVVKGGVLGTRVLSATDAGALADVAPREVVLAQLAGALAAPLRQLAGLLAAVPRNVAYGLSALIQKGGTTAPAEAPAPADAFGHAGGDAFGQAGGEPTAPEPPPAAEAPTTEAAAPEAPTTEAPTTEAPTTEAPTTEAPTTEAPTTGAAAPEAPTTGAAAPEAPTTEAPTTEAPTTEAPTTEAAAPEAAAEAEAAPVEAAQTEPEPAEPEPAEPIPPVESADAAEAAEKES